MLAAGGDDASRTLARDALAQLCAAYWYPLYAFVRARGHAADDAQDLTQAFFLRIIETNGLATAEPGRGRFRSYLLGAMKHFLANEWHRSRTQRRGGGAVAVPLDALEAEARWARGPVARDDPDAGFDRAWALDSIARAIDTLRAECERKGKGELFAALEGSLTGEEPERAETAARLGLTEGALKVAVHRLRKRYREILRAGIAETLSDPADIDDEMRHLVAALRRNSGTTR